jgi:hypothetical protein
MAWAVRIRGPGGQATITLAAGGATSAAELRAALAEAAGLDAARVEALGGFPPKPLQVRARGRWRVGLYVDAAGTRVLQGRGPACGVGRAGRRGAARMQ